jgi:hypothetical protein
VSGFDVLPKPRRGNWHPPMPQRIVDRGVTRERMWAALPADGSWLSMAQWRDALGLSDIHHGQFGHAIGSADVSNMTWIRSVTYYRRRVGDGPTHILAGPRPKIAATASTPREPCPSAGPDLNGRTVMW